MLHHANRPPAARAEGYRVLEFRVLGFGSWLVAVWTLVRVEEGKIGSKEQQGLGCSAWGMLAYSVAKPGEEIP